MKLMSSILIGTLLLSGCIETVTEEDAVDNPSTGDNPETGSGTLEGRVADGYLVDANVCLDLNGNNACDDNEPSAMSSAGGLFSIVDVTPEQLKNNAVIVEAIVGQTYDEDAPSITIDQAFTLTAPIGQTFISPLTTIIKSNMDRGMSYSNALTQLITRTGLQIDPTVDYVAAKNDPDLSAEDQADYESAHEIAKIITGLIAARTTNDETLSLTEIAEEVDQQLAKIASAVETAEENNEEVFVDDIITEIHDDIENLETIACNLSNELCGIWHEQEVDEDDSYNFYIDVTSLQGGINGYVVEFNRCERIPLFIKNSEISYVSDDLDRVNVNNIYERYSIILSDTYEVIGPNLVTTVTTVDFANETYSYSKVHSLPEMCTQLPSVDTVTETVSVENDIIGHWIGSEKPFNSDPQSDIAVILREDGTATYLDGFDANNLVCEDHEIEMTWVLNGDGKVVFTDPDPGDGDISEFFLFKTSGNSLIEKEGYYTAREWSPTSLTEQQLRDKCSSDPLNGVDTDPDTASETDPATADDFVTISNLYDIEGVTFSHSNELNLDFYTVLTASSMTTGVFTQYFPSQDVDGNACTIESTSHVSIIEVPIDSETTTSGLYGQDTLNANDPYIILLMQGGYTDTHRNTVTISLVGGTISSASSASSDVIDSLPVLPTTCN